MVAEGGAYTREAVARLRDLERLLSHFAGGKDSFGCRGCEAHRMDAHAPRSTDGVPSAVPIHPLLFAAYPVVRLYEQNVAEVEPGDLVLPFLVVLGGTALGMALLNLLMRDARRAAIVTSAILLPVLIFGLLREIAEPALADARVIVLAICGAIIVTAVVVALRIGPRLGPLTLALNVGSLVLVLMAAVPSVGAFAAVAGDDEVPMTDVNPVTGGHTSDGRDVYHLVLDRYGSERALETGFGIHNEEFVGWLRENGFQVSDDARANYTKTTMSLASTLGMSLLDHLASRMSADSEDLAPVIHRIQKNRAGAFLQELGYEYIHVGSWFDPTRDSHIADRSYNPDEEVSFATTLYDYSILPSLVNRPKPADNHKRKHARSVEYQFALLDEVIDEPGPKYVFAHILVPHPPYVFLEDGSYAPKGATFETQLADTNRRVRALLEPLLALPEGEQPIIIVQADEGPFPRRFAGNPDDFEWAAATDDELVTKYGVLSAMHLPGPEGAAPLRPDMTLVNTYPELFRRYFGSHMPDQPDRSYASDTPTPYDLIDITERLDTAAD